MLVCNSTNISVSSTAFVIQAATVSDKSDLHIVQPVSDSSGWWVGVR